MRRAARILFHLTAGVSAILFFAGAGLWVASYRAEHRVSRWGRERYWAMHVSRGVMGMYRVWYDDPDAPYVYSQPELRWERFPPVDLRVDAAPHLPPEHVAIAGFLYARGPTFNGPASLLLIPLPFLVALLALLPLGEVMMIHRRRRRRRRAAAGLCVRCGYDLRATPETCPECGAVPSARLARPPGAGG